MEMQQPGEITVLLRAWGNGDHAALDLLTPLVYQELHKVARNRMRAERAGDNTLQASALVNEAYLRMVNADEVNFSDRTHFFAVSARIMRRILVDAARARATEKRGSGQARINLNEALDGTAQPDAGVVALDDALQGLEKLDPRKARVIELRFFAGLSLEETAEVLSVSVETVSRDWKLAKSWLRREMEGD